MNESIAMNDKTRVTFNDVNIQSKNTSNSDIPPVLFKLVPDLNEYNIVGDNGLKQKFRIFNIILCKSCI